MLNTTEVNPGLEGVVAADTRLSSVDGQHGELLIAGFPVETLAPKASFEETVYLLWHDTLPDIDRLAAFRHELQAARALPPATLELLHAAAMESIPPMDALRMAAGTLSLPAPGLVVSDAQATANAVVARFPTIIAAYWRLLHGDPLVDPDPQLDHAANFLYMLTGEIPHPERTRGLETYLNTVVDHGLNASTFTARVIIATGSDLVSAITGAIGALKGPLHGGAPGPALDMVFEIGEVASIDRVLRQKLATGERLMGFGHRVYRVRDPRADVLAVAAEHMYQAAGDMQLYTLAKAVEERAVALLAEHKPGRNLQTNVEFYTALLLHGLDLPTELFTPTFAISRVVGWIAHCFEQQALHRIIRPQSIYHGPRDRQWVPLTER
ncbi:MAG: citrate synthase/methylcitrate synthase [Herpetosiphonaceae bacterium]|nr:citrate synthase/methylcitrate synthase [Herpetosiphonaceae bacterium]